ncbi:Kef-type K+ transport system membrane component KefB [Bradyrhizobium sp. LM4.3]
MASLDSVSLAILLGAVLVLAGILSSLLALRFGAPLLLVFLAIGMLAGDSGPGQLQFDDVRTTYLVGSVALALILFDGGLKTRFASIRTVLAPSVVLATVGVLLTALITAPFAKYALDLNWTESLLVGAVVASTDAAAVFLLVHTQGLRLRPRVGATLEVESGTNDPFAIFLTLMLVEYISLGTGTAGHVMMEFLLEAVLGAVVGFLGGRLVVVALNQVALPQGLHAPFVTTAALVIFGGSQIMHASGFLAVYLAGIIIGNRPTRAHNSVVAFLDAATWLAQIVMFVLLGLLVSPSRLGASVLPGGRDRLRADAGGAADRGVRVPGAVPLQLAREDLHRLDRPARCGRDLPGLDPDAGRADESLSLFRRRLCCRHHLAAAAGLDAGAGRAQASCRAAARRARPAPRRARSARPARAATRRLSGAAQEPVFPPRPDPVLVQADAGDPQREHFDAG